jgi:hypothetical protein
MAANVTQAVAIHHATMNLMAEKIIIAGGICLIHLRNEASIFRSCSYGCPDIEASTDRECGANLSEYKCSDRHEEDCNKLGCPHGEGSTGENTEKECQSKLVSVATPLI